MEEDKEILKPCPFCGSEAELVDLDKGAYVWCTNGKCVMEHGDHNWTRKYAIESWNRRVK